MPLLILAALVVIVLMLYIALGGKEGAPTISLNKIFEFINPKPPADADAQDASAPEAAKEAPAAPAAGGSESAKAAPEPAEPKGPAPAEAPAADREQTESAKGEEVPEGASFASMEELTDFYRKEAERLTGIKH
ncbi:MAG: hypothetical protein LBB57_02700 [Clostridiales Family XIII bacterium]|jgi:hypothetical protein|nr:hypothetical protein [Clostridiales Family XIII bacterium]